MHSLQLVENFSQTNDDSVLFGLCFACLKFSLSNFLLTYLYCLQHKDLKENAVASFGAKVDSHDCHMYIFTPKTGALSEI